MYIHLCVAGRSVTHLWYGRAGTSCSLSVWRSALRSWVSPLSWLPSSTICRAAYRRVCQLCNASRGVRARDSKGKRWRNVTVLNVLVTNHAVYYLKTSCLVSEWSWWWSTSGSCRSSVTAWPSWRRTAMSTRTWKPSSSSVQVNACSWHSSYTGQRITTGIFGSCLFPRTTHSLSLTFRYLEVNKSELMLWHKA